MANKYDVFLSHNRAEKPFVERLATRIEADDSGRPLRVFFDKWDIGPGADIPRELEQAIDTSRRIGLVVSPDSIASDWVALERSSAVFADPAARAARLVPLLRRDAQLPAALARLRYIDFRRDRDFDTGFAELIDLLRDQPPRRGHAFDPDQLALREDAVLVAQHRVIFDRPAFKTSCIEELFIEELNEALDDVAASLASGRLYSRSGRLLAEFPRSDAYRVPEFRAAVMRAREGVTAVKRMTVQFENFVDAELKGEPHHRNFWSLLQVMTSERGAGEGPQSRIALTRSALRGMDAIDDARNGVLNDVNFVLARCGEPLLDQIERSSAVNARMGWFDDH